jgi:polysaccharide chain length determinant protein (PEP-CTERM system associated)
LSTQVSKLRESIKVVAQPDNLIEISATASVSGFSNAQNARLSSAIVQGLLDLFVEENLSGDRAETGQSLAFLDEELKRREAQLQEAEQRRAEFEAKYLGMLPGSGPLDQRMALARTELAGLEQQLIAAQSGLTAVRSQMSGVPATISTPSFAAGGGVGVASSQIAQLEAQLAQSQGRGWTDQHPDVIATRSQIERLRGPAARERAAAGSGGGMISTPNPAFASLRAMAAEKEAQVAAASARKAQLETAMRQYADAQTANPEAVAEQARLSRDYEVLKRQYDKLLEDREQVRLRSDVQTKTNAIRIRVIEPPSKPNVPVAPNRPIFLTAILFLAIAGGIGAAFAMGQLRTTFPTQARLEQVTGMPVLGSVTEVMTAARKAERTQRLKWFGGAGAALAGSYALLMLVEFWQRSMVA